MMIRFIIQAIHTSFWTETRMNCYTRTNAECNMFSKICLTHPLKLTYYSWINNLSIQKQVEVQIASRIATMQSWEKLDIAEVTKGITKEENKLIRLHQIWLANRFLRSDRMMKVFTVTSQSIQLNLKNKNKAVNKHRKTNQKF